MFGIFNTALRVATLSESRPGTPQNPATCTQCTSRHWFDETPRDPRSGLRLGESWADRA